MRIAVCVKQIPDPATPYELDPDSHLSFARTTRFSTTPTVTASRSDSSSQKQRKAP